MESASGSGSGSSYGDDTQPNLGVFSIIMLTILSFALALLSLAIIYIAYTEHKDRKKENNRIDI